MIATYAGQKLGPEMAVLSIGLVAVYAFVCLIIYFWNRHDRQSEARSRSRYLYLLEIADRRDITRWKP